MCTPKANGGQRCSSSTAKSLSGAANRAERATEQYKQAVERDAGPTLRAELRARVTRSYYAWEDALVEHTTTDAGAAEIEHLLSTSPDYRPEGDGHVGPTARSYLSALHNGVGLRHQRAEIKKTSENGGVWESLIKTGEWPREGERRYREQEIEAVRVRELAAARPSVNLPAGVTADEGTHITDIYFACENHSKPGSCSAECTALVAGMDSDSYVEYDPTGTSYGPPKPHTQYHYDEAQRASIAVTLTPV